MLNSPQLTDHEKRQLRSMPPEQRIREIQTRNRRYRRTEQLLGIAVAPLPTEDLRRYEKAFERGALPEVGARTFEQAMCAVVVMRGDSGGYLEVRDEDHPLHKHYRVVERVFEGWGFVDRPGASGPGHGVFRTLPLHLRKQLIYEACVRERMSREVEDG